MTMIRMKHNTKQAHNDNTRRQFITVGFSVQEYLDITDTLDETGLPFHAVMLENAHELIRFMHHTPHLVAAVMINNNSDQQHSGIHTLRLARKELAHVPTILTVSNEKEALFITTNHIADASVVHNRSTPFSSDGIFNAMWEAAGHHQVAHANDDVGLAE